MPGPKSPECVRLKSVFLVSNVHCASCVAYIKEVLSEISAVSGIDVSIFTHEVCVYHGPATGASELAAKLIQAAFEVHYVTTYDPKGIVISELDTTSWLSRKSMFIRGPKGSCSVSSSESQLHIANCDACRKEVQQGGSDSSYLGKSEKNPTRPLYDGSRTSETETLVQPTPSIAEHKPPLPSRSSDEFKAVISIGGMTCSSCVNAITAEVEGLEFTKDITVNLLTNSASLVYFGPRSNIDKVLERIEDIGFEASVDQINDNSPTRSPEGYVAELAIGGMTCGSCVAAITSALEELPFVSQSSVNLMSSSARVEVKARENIADVIEKIEDLGYDASLSSVQPLVASDDSNTTRSRTVAIRVDGMFCHHCPPKVVDALQKFPGVEVEGQLSVKKPILKITYVPTPSLTIRSILSALDATDPSFTASVYHPPTIEDRSRAMQRHERRRLLSRLLFVFIVAIPTFLIGVVFMSLVSADNPVRAYFERRVWVGGTSRTEWALFIMTTPVMIYGTDVFHLRALKEIHTLWRPGSHVPILRRFYRFGSMNLLVSAGTAVAYFSSLAVLIIDAVVGTASSTHSSTYFDSVVFLTLFILAGRFLEAYSRAKTGDAVSSLGKLRPTEALLLEGDSSSGGQNADGDGIRRINVDLLEIGDTVSIPHGTSPPADGVITTAGSYQFDESSLTGESKPVKKSTGDSVFTGSVNVGQPVQIKLSELGGTSMLDQIIAVVREGQSKRAPLEAIADVLVSHFVPAITLIAVVTFLIWLALGFSGILPADYLDVTHGGWAFWALEFAISVFVVACPCGLALAAPTALFVGGGLAARNGILVKGGGEAFQEASRLDAIVFDKTGTLTEGGSLKVSDHELLSKDPELQQVAWTITRKLEESSNHPLARAIMEFCSDKESASIESSDIHEIPGHGMRGTFNLSTGTSGSEQHPVQYEAAIGNERLLHQLILPDTDGYYLSTLLSKYQSTGKSTAILSLRKAGPEHPDEPFSPVMVFATSDLIRSEAAQVISRLRNRNLDVYMCTGDNTTTAHAVADMLGIPRLNILANVMPAEKATFVREVQESAEHHKPGSRPSRRRIVAFVGDGVNDSPALAAADVSIAMASGSDVAINSASFILLNSELDTILQLVVLSRRVFNRVRMNFGWAVVYNIILVPIAAGVLYPIANGHRKEVVNGEVVWVDSHWRLSPVWAALAMALSSISVISSSLALGVEEKVRRRFFG